MEPKRDKDRLDLPAPESRGYGCGCQLTGSALALVVLTIVLAALLAGSEDLRGSLLWLVMIPLVVGFLALFVRVQRYRGP
ncbi:MAG: hypothetical protein J4N83_04110 [Chloroflexi bacterium]|nr:hypothetical protein [Chloroflexota bacterium]